MVWLLFGAGATSWRRRMFPPSDRTIGDPGWPGIRRYLIASAGILPVPSEPPALHLRLDLRPAWVLTVLGAIELLGDQALIPSQDGVGLATQATSRSALRPRRFPISARVARSGLLNRSLDGSLALRMSFSAARYSFCSRSLLVHSTRHVRQQS